jgi:hypothetical protein
MLYSDRRDLLLFFAALPDPPLPHASSQALPPFLFYNRKLPTNLLLSIVSSIFIITDPALFSN